jgi:hypothetical protein
MVELELRSPRFERRTADVKWIAVATLRVDGDRHWLRDPGRLLDLSVSLPSPRYEHEISFPEDPEEWARSLTLTWGGSDLVPTIVFDTNPWPQTETLDEAPTLPDAYEVMSAEPEPAYELAATWSSALRR